MDRRIDGHAGLERFCPVIWASNNPKRVHTGSYRLRRLRACALARKAHALHLSDSKAIVLSVSQPLLLSVFLRFLSCRFSPSTKPRLTLVRTSIVCATFRASRAHVVLYIRPLALQSEHFSRLMAPRHGNGSKHLFTSNA